MTIKKVVVAGGGVLGSQIALQSAYCGFDVTIWLRSEGSIERAKPKLERFKNIYVDTLEKMKTDANAYCRGLSKKTDLSDSEIDELKQNAEDAYNNIILTTSYDEAASGADLIIEAIAENPEQKIAFYQELAKHMDEETILVTNSSTLLPSMFAEYTGRPEKYLSLHFANTIWENNTAEVMGHPGTDQKYYDEVAQFAEDINMIPISSSLKVFAKCKAHLRKIGKIVDDADILIGATAIDNKFVMVTENIKHFENLPGITLENWVKR